MFWIVTQSLLSGLATTFEIFILTLIFALPLGLILAFGLLSKFTPLKRLVQILVWIIRGTPLMLQLIIIFTGRACGCIRPSGAEMKPDVSQQRLWHL